eukprot:5978107-Alexandrium_andersonii.AAC.1
MGPSRAPETDSELVSGSPSPSSSQYVMVATMTGYHYHHHDRLSAGGAAGRSAGHFAPWEPSRPRPPS